MNAFFATAHDVPACLGRSVELRRFFDNDPAPEAYALLGMKKEERSVLGMELQGDAVQREVAQTQVSFSGHRIIAASPPAGWAPRPPHPDAACATSSSDRWSRSRRRLPTAAAR